MFLGHLSDGFVTKTEKFYIKKITSYSEGERIDCILSYLTAAQSHTWRGGWVCIGWLWIASSCLIVSLGIWLSNFLALNFPLAQVPYLSVGAENVGSRTERCRGQSQLSGYPPHWKVSVLHSNRGFSVVRFSNDDSIRIWIFDFSCRQLFI